MSEMKFKVGDLVLYDAHLDPNDLGFIAQYSRHETSIGFVTRVANNPTRDCEEYDVAWISHNFTDVNNIHTGWTNQVLRKVGHVKVDP